MYKDVKVPDSVREQYDLSDNVALITGGAGFLGFKFAEAISEMGGLPILLDIKEKSLRKSKKKLKDLGHKSHYYVVDNTDEVAVKTIIKSILSKFRKIDVLINSAGLTKSGIEDTNLDFFAPFEETNQELWDLGLKVNISGVQICCKVIGAAMKESGKGSIINIASDLGVISPNQRIYEPDGKGYDGVDFNSPAFYAVSKAGVIHLTKFLATYWAKDNIRVNSISPAGIYRNHTPQFVEKLSELIPMGRMALPQELKGAIAFLASDASSFVTGHNLVVDGGRTVW